MFGWKEDLCRLLAKMPSRTEVPDFFLSVRFRVMTFGLLRLLKPGPALMSLCSFGLCERDENLTAVMSCFILEDVYSMGRCFVLLSGVSFSHEKEEEEKGR